MALHGGLSFCKTQQVVGFDCAGIERLSVPQPNYCLLLGEPIREGRLIPDAFRSFRDLLDIHVRKFQVSHLFMYPRLSS